MSAPPSVAAAIEAAREEPSRDGSRTAAEIVEVDQEISKLGRAIDNLVQQRATLVEYRARLASESDARQERTQLAAHQALYVALEAQAAALHRRGEEWAGKTHDRRERARQDPTVAALVDEIATSRAALDTASDPPAEALAHHEQLENRLRARLAEQTQPTPFEGPELSVDLVCCVDAPDGTPELLVVLLPVRAGVGDPAGATDQLPLWLAARTAQALFAAARAVDFAEADVRTGPALGYDLLDIEVDLGAAPEGFVPELLRTLSDHLAASPEIAAGQVTVRVSELDAAIVFPTEEADRG